MQGQIEREEVFVGLNTMTRPVEATLSFQAEGTRMYAFYLSAEKGKRVRWLVVSTKEYVKSGEFIGTVVFGPRQEYHLFELEEEDE